MVVGSGCSGAAIAGRLAESGASVIVVEAGKSDEKFLVKKPGMIGPMHSVPEIKSDRRLGLLLGPAEAPARPQDAGPAGKVVGGSSSINGMVYVRGNRANFDDWAAEGNTGWDADSVNAAYKRMEDFEDGEDDFRGAGGPIKVTRNKMPQEGVAPVPPGDRRHARREDPRRLQRGVAGGRQPDAAERRRRPALQRLARLHPPPRAADPAAADRGAVTQGGHRERPRGRHRGAGRQQEGRRRERTIRAGKEVILSAGFVGSRADPDALGHRPRPAPHASTASTVVADLPVGDNLHDHLFHALTFHVHDRRSSAATALLLRQGRGARRCSGRATTFLANSVFESVAFVRTSQATDVPDLQLHLLPWSYVSPNQDEPIRHDVDPRTSLTVLSTLIYPQSRGTLRLASGDPTAGAADRLPVPRRPGRPRGARRGLGDGPRDHGRRGVRRRGQGARSTPAPELQGQALRDAILNRATSVYHGVGTCRMGVDELRRRRPRPQGPRHRGPAGLRRLDHAVDHRRQHQRALDHDRRARRRARPRRERLT